MRAGQGSTSSWTKQVFAAVAGGGGSLPPSCSRAVSYLPVEAGTLACSPSPFVIADVPLVGDSLHFLPLSPKAEPGRGLPQRPLELRV